MHTEFSISGLAKGGCLAGGLLLSCLLLASMTPLDDDAMADISGAGIAMAFEDFRWMVKPTSYFEQVGSAPGVGATWQRGDLRWYGVNVSGAGAGGSHFNEYVGGFGTPCDASSLECPRGGVIPFFAAHDNPYLLRAFSPLGRSFTGAQLNLNPNNPDKSIYEFLAPTQQDDYTMSFWGEIKVNNDVNQILKSQTIIRGNASGSAFRLFQFTQPGNETFAILYHSRLRGDFRFSASHALAGAGAEGMPPLFDDREGVHFRNVDAYIPLGQLYYQALTLDAVGVDGNFELKIPKLPNDAAVWGDFYALRTGDVAGYETARRALAGNFDGNNAGLKNYEVSHGYSRWGDWFPDCRNVTGNLATGCLATTGTRNAYNATNDGIYFRRCGGAPACANVNAYARRMTAYNVENGSKSFAYYGANPYGIPVSGAGAAAQVVTADVNIGDSRIDGLLINHLRFVSCMGSATC